MFQTCMWIIFTKWNFSRQLNNNISNCQHLLHLCLLFLYSFDLEYPNIRVAEDVGIVDKNIFFSFLQALSKSFLILTYNFFWHCWGPCRVKDALKDSTDFLSNAKLRTWVVQISLTNTQKSDAVTICEEKKKKDRTLSKEIHFHWWMWLSATTINVGIWLATSKETCTRPKLIF